MGGVQAVTKGHGVQKHFKHAACQMPLQYCIFFTLLWRNWWSILVEGKQ